MEQHLQLTQKQLPSESCHQQRQTNRRWLTDAHHQRDAMRRPPVTKPPSALSAGSGEITYARPLAVQEGSPEPAYDNLMDWRLTTVVTSRCVRSLQATYALQPKRARSLCGEYYVWGLATQHMSTLQCHVTRFQQHTAFLSQRNTDEQSWRRPADRCVRRQNHMGLQATHKRRRMRANSWSFQTFLSS